MEKTGLVLSSAAVAVNAAKSQTYEAHDLGKLKAFLVQPSEEDGKTNGEQLGLTAANVASLNTNRRSVSANDNWVSKVSGLEWTESLPKRISSIGDDTWSKSLAGSLDVSGCTALGTLSCNYNQLSQLDVSGCTALAYLSCSDNRLSQLDASGCTALKYLSCSDNQLSQLDMSGCTALTGLRCLYNQLTQLNVSGCMALTRLDCHTNQLTQLDVSGCTALGTLDCSDNPLTDMIVGWTAIPSLSVSFPDVSQVTLHVPVGRVPLYKFADKWKDFGNIVKIGGGGETPTSTYDAHDLGKLKAFLVQDSAKDGKSNGEQLGLTAADVASLNTNGSWVENVGGIIWTETTSKRISSIGKNLIWNRRSLAGSLDVSGCMALEELSCYSNQLSQLDVSGCTALKELSCGSNQLSQLDVSGCTALVYLECWANQLSQLDITGCTALSSLYCDDNQLSQLDISGCTSLSNLYCHTNPLTDLTVGWTTIPSRDCLSLPAGLSKATLHVSADTAALYRAADRWKEFGTIVEI